MRARAGRHFSRRDPHQKVGNSPDATSHQKFPQEKLPWINGDSDGFATTAPVMGAAFVLHGGARAVLKLVPFWGDMVSGGIAAAGTYGIGRAAIAYFIDGVSLTSAKETFRAKGKPKQLSQPK